MAPAIEARIEDLDHDGRGVCRVDGKVVFVDDCLPGELVRLQVRRRRSSYEDASLVEVVEAAEQRVEPPCEHASVCGGCRLQHLSPGGQIEYKKKRLLEDLRRLGGVVPDVELATIAGATSGYRRKARFGAKFVPAKGGVLVGFREKHAPYVADISKCQVVRPEFGLRLEEFKTLLSRLTVHDRVPQLEVAAGDDGLAVVVRHLSPLDQQDRELLAEFSRQHGIRVLLQPAGPESVVPLHSQDSQYLHYRQPGLGRDDTALELRFKVTDFIQVNAEVNRKLVGQALDLLNLHPRHSVLDLFCGLGNFSLATALRAARVTGVEGDPGLVDGARHNANANRIRNARFEVGDLFSSRIVERYGSAGYDRWLLDPPRSGALELVRALCPPYPPRIVYVSCNSSTLARDAAILTAEKGYRLASAGLVDMFPHTAHAEAIALFIQNPEEVAR